MGAILRTAEGFGVDKVILSGYTPRVHDERLLPHLRAKLDKEISKTALGAEDLVRVEVTDDVLGMLGELRGDGAIIVGLENNINTDKLVRLNDPALKGKLGDNVVLVLGEEVNGIDKSLYETMQLFIEIPMVGQKESFNVSVAAGIAMYGIMLG